MDRPLSGTAELADNAFNRWHCAQAVLAYCDRMPRRLGPLAVIVALGLIVTGCVFWSDGDNTQDSGSPDGEASADSGSESSETDTGGGDDDADPGGAMARVSRRSNRSTVPLPSPKELRPNAISSPFRRTGTQGRAM